MNIYSLAAKFLESEKAKGNSKITQEDIQNAYKNISDDFAKAGYSHEPIWDINADGDGTIDEEEFIKIMNTALSDVNNKSSNVDDYKIFFGIFNEDNDNGIKIDEYNGIISSNNNKDGSAITGYSLWTTFLHGENEDEAMNETLSIQETEIQQKDISSGFNTILQNVSDSDIEEIAEKIINGEEELNDYASKLIHDDFMELSDTVDEIQKNKTEKADVTVSSSRLKNDNGLTEISKSDVNKTNTNVATKTKSSEIVNVSNSNGDYSKIGNTIDAALEKRLDSKLGNGFCKRVEEIAKNINCNPNDLLAMMYCESGLDAHRHNAAGSSAVGLIQFLQSTIENLGYTREEMLSMSNVEQLDVVEKFFVANKNWKFNSNTKLDAGTLYALCFLPNEATAEVLCNNSSKLTWAYNANTGLDQDKDGQITKNDLSAIIAKKYNEMYQYF